MFMTASNQVVGFSIDLCKRVVNSIERQINVSGLQIKWVAVGTQTRFDAVMKGLADMECGASTVTLSRMKMVDFSSYIFVETTGLMVKDVRLCLEESKALGLSMEVAEAVGRLWEVVIREMGPESDFTAAIQPIEKSAGVIVKGKAS